VFKSGWTKISLLFILFSSNLMSFQKREEAMTKVNKLTINFQEGDLPTVHPHDLIIYLRGIAAGKLLYEGLTRLDENGKVRLAGAEALDVSQDRLTYTFTLRDNKWSDGSPVTAHQYENAWKEAISPKSTCTSANLFYLIQNAEKAKKGEAPLDAVGVKAVDAKTLVVRLEHPSSFFLDLIAQPICAPLVDPKKKEISSFNGPFVIDTWKKNDCLKLVRNPFFWNKHRVLLDEINVLMASDSSTIYNFYESGKVDWIGVPFSPLSSEQIQHLQTKNVLLSRPIARSFWVNLNTRHPALSSTPIRQALSLALDRANITRHIMKGGDPLWRALSDALLPVKMKVSSLLKEDEEEARLRFQQGLLGLGIAKEKFPMLTVSYAQQSNRKKFAEYLQEAWKRVLGIDVRVEQQEWNVLRKNLEKGQFEVCAAYEASYYHDPMEILENLGDSNPRNFTQWAHSGYRQIIAAARQESDSERRFQLLGKAEEIILQETPFIPICTDQFLFTHPSGLKGYAFDSVGAVDFSYASFKDTR
jgi:oligopeptide transport system substrate-binding protein